MKFKVYSGCCAHGPILTGFEGLYGVPGMEICLAVCKTSAFSPVLVLKFQQKIFLSHTR